MADAADAPISREDGRPVPYVSLADLAMLRADPEFPMSAEEAAARRTQYAEARLLWAQRNAPIAEEFYGQNRRMLAAILDARGKVYLLYRAGEVAAVEPGFAEALTRVEFLQTQSDVLLGSNVFYEGSVSYEGSALIGTQLYSIAR